MRDALLSWAQTWQSLKMRQVSFNPTFILSNIQCFISTYLCHGDGFSRLARGPVRVPLAVAEQGEVVHNSWISFSLGRWKLQRRERKIRS